MVFHRNLRLFINICWLFLTYIVTFIVSCLVAIFHAWNIVCVHWLLPFLNILLFHKEILDVLIPFANQSCHSSTRNLHEILSHFSFLIRRYCHICCITTTMPTLWPLTFILLVGRCTASSTIQFDHTEFLLLLSHSVAHERPWVTYCLALLCLSSLWLNQCTCWLLVYRRVVVYCICVPTHRHTPSLICILPMVNCLKLLRVCEITWGLRVPTNWEWVLLTLLRLSWMWIGSSHLMHVCV